MPSPIYFVIPQRRLAGSPSGSAFTFPRLVDGQGYRVPLRFLDVIDGEFVEVERGVRALACSIGQVDARPQAGAFSLQILLGAPAVGANTTDMIDRAESAANFEKKLNLLTGKPAGMNVREVNGGWVIWRADGGELQLEIVESTLWPFAFADVRRYQEGAANRYELRLRCSPLSFTDDFERVDPEDPKVVRIQSGFTSDGGITKTNEVQKLLIPQGFRAAFMLRDTRTGTTSRDLTLTTAGEQEFSDAINAILKPGETALVNDVTTTGSIEVRIEYQGDLAGVAVDLLEVIVAPDAPPGDVTFTIPLDQPAFYEALRISKALDAQPLELTLDLVATKADEANLAVAAERVKSTGLSVNLARSQTFAGQATQRFIGWLRPPKSTGYLPFNDSMVGVGQPPYAVAIGDGATTHFVIDHNLGTQVLTGYVAIDRATKRILVPGTDYTAYATSDNSVTVDFTTAPAVVGANSGVSFAIAVPQSLEVFLAGFHIGIANVDGLEARLTTIETSLATVVPGVGSISATATGDGFSQRVRDKFMIFPRADDAAVAALVADLKAEAADGIPKAPDVDEAALPRPPYLLPAIHDVDVEEYTYPGALPSATSIASQVFALEGGSVLLPGKGGIRSQTAPDNGWFGSDGRLLYPVVPADPGDDEATRSFYPSLYEKVLFTNDCNDALLVVGGKLEITFYLGLQLLAANCQAQYILSIETCPYDRAVAISGTPYGPNLRRVDWAADGRTILQIPLVLDSSLMTHRFGLRVSRTGTQLPASVLTYNTWRPAVTNPLPAPIGEDPLLPNFAIRARLSNFDTEDVFGALGYVYASLMSHQLIVSTK
jgi:hypothetical protein